MPPFAACLMFELHKIQGKHHVKIFYREGDKQPAELLYQSSLEDFETKYHDVIPSGDYDTECKPINPDIEKHF